MLRMVIAVMGRMRTHAVEAYETAAKGNMADVGWLERPG